MNDNRISVSYSQYNEDIILRALFEGVLNGFYVDVGANDPNDDSVTKVFYDMGWHGINIEPINKLYDQLKKDRPRDINLNYGVGARAGTLKFREYKTIPGHSKLANVPEEAQDKKLESTEYEINIRTLKDILGSHKVNHIHFLKIDVEGTEYEVISGNDWQKYRPEVICVETNHVEKDLHSILLENNYKLFISDGLNEYYVAKEALNRTDGFLHRAIDLSAHTLRYDLWKSWDMSAKELRKLRKTIKEQTHQENGQTLKVNRLEEELKAAKVSLSSASSLTLKDISLKRRIKRAIYGLTIDWVRYKTNKTK